MAAARTDQDLGREIGATTLEAIFGVGGAVAGAFGGPEAGKLIAQGGRTFGDLIRGKKEQTSVQATPEKQKERARPALPDLSKEEVRVPTAKTSQRQAPTEQDRLESLRAQIRASLERQRS